MPRGNRVRMLKTLIRHTYNRFGEAIEIRYEKGKVYNFPVYIAAKMRRKGIATNA